MPRKKNTESENEIVEKLNYIGLDFDNIPKTIKEFKPLEFKPLKITDGNQYRQYKYIPVKDIELLLSPTNRLEDIQKKYNNARPVYSYLVPDTEENVLRHTTFLNMLNKVKIEDIEAIEQEQKELNKKMPFKVKFPGNYLWQIYYSENTDRYFMLVPTDDSDYSTFFYVLKKKLEKKKTGKVFVPISNVGYSTNCLKKSEFEDIENYLWLFTKDYPLIYEVSDKNEELSIQIIGETEVFPKIRTFYKVKLVNQVEAIQFYKLLKALFILQTELPHYYKFETNIDKQGSLELYYKGKKIEYNNLTEFIRNEYIKLERNKEDVICNIEDLNNKLEQLKSKAVQLEGEYLVKEKQISTFLECKKSFFGKVKYFFKYNKKKKIHNEDDIKVNKNEYNFKKQKEAIINTIKKQLKEYYTLDELIDSYREYEKIENESKNLLMDVNAIKLKTKNLNKKIDNAISFIEEIDDHKKSIFEFWRYSNKDEMTSLPEGEGEILNVVSKISKVFDYKEDIEEFGKNIDEKQRIKLSKEELDSIYITTTDIIDILNKIKTNNFTLKQIELNLKELKKQFDIEKSVMENEEFDVFGGIVDDRTKVKNLGNKKHREFPKDKASILQLNKNTKSLEYKLALEKILQNVVQALKKSILDESLPVYLATNEEKIDLDKLNVFNLNLEQELNYSMKMDDKKINLFKMNLNVGTKAICYSNSVYYDNKNKTLPLGMNVSSKILVDTSSVDLKLKDKKILRILSFEDDKDYVSKSVIKTVNLYEYDISSL